MKTHGFAVNQVKLQRAIAAAKGDESRVRELYEAMGGLVQKGYETVEQPPQDNEHVAEGCEQFNDGMIIEGEGTFDEKGNLESTVTKVEVKKRGRKPKNA